VRHLVTYSDARAAGRELREQAGVTLAYRPLDRPWDVLVRQDLHYAITGRGGARVREVAHVLATHAGWRLDARSQLALAWAGKLTRHVERRAVSAGGAQWLRGRYTRDLARDFDVALTASALTGRSWSQHALGVGAEVGRQLPGGVWLSLGYNLHGYADDALTGEEWTRQGAFLRLRARLDESLLQRPRGWAP
jgi:hypothetical protein